MSSRNENSSASAGMGLVMMAVVGIVMIVFFAMAFAAFVLTILSVLAWHKPLRIGRWIIEPEVARAFVGRGVVGAMMVPSFFLFIDLVFGLSISWSYWPYFVGGGYVAGSVGIELLLAQSRGYETPAAEQLMQQLPPQQSQEPTQRKPFEFASWEDEGEDR